MPREFPMQSSLIFSFYDLLCFLTKIEGYSFPLPATVFHESHGTYGYETPGALHLL